jgi:hypothetical protein
MTRKFPSVSRSARLVLLGGLAWSGISFASPPDEPKPSESTAAEADVAQPAPDPYLTTAPPPGYETFVDAQGRRYFVLTVRKKEGAFVRVGTTHVQFKGGYVLEIDSETDDELRVRKYLSTGERAAPARPKPPAPDLAAIARSYEIALPQGDVLTLSSFDRGLPRTGQWRNGFDLGDLDGDGRLEIVFGPARKGRPVPSLFRHDGAGGWSAETSSRFPRQRYDYGDASVADWNGDGRLDLAFGMHLLGIVALTEDGAGGYAPWSRGIDLAAPDAPGGGAFSSRALEVADWNRDGRPDLIALGDGPRMPTAEPGQQAARQRGPAAAANGVVIHLNRGDGSWEARRDASALGAELFGDSLAVADLDRDGDLDLAIGARKVGRREILGLQGSDGAISWTELPGLRPRALVDSVVAADLDRDGWQDVVVGYRSNEGVWRMGVDLFYGGAGGWTRKALTAREGNDAVLAVAVGDLDGDGDPDVAALPTVGEIWLFLGGEAREWTRELVIPDELGSAGESCAGYAARIADLDGDRRGEIIAAFAGDPGTRNPFGIPEPETCLSGGSLRVWKTAPAGEGSTGRDPAEAH